MAVEIETLFTSALGLTAPWRVSSVELKTGQMRVDFHMTCDGKYLPCPLCLKLSKAFITVLSASGDTWTSFEYEAWLHAELPRVICTNCDKTTQVQVPWAQEGSCFTVLFRVACLVAMP